MLIVERLQKARGDGEPCTREGVHSSVIYALLRYHLRVITSVVRYYIMTRSWWLSPRAGHPAQAEGGDGHPHTPNLNPQPLDPNP